MALDSPDTHTKLIAFLNTEFTGQDKDTMQHVIQLSMSPWWDLLTQGNATITIDLMKKYFFAQFIVLPLIPRWTGSDGGDAIAGDVSRALAISAQKLLTSELGTSSASVTLALQSCVCDPIISAAYSIKGGRNMGQFIQRLYELIEELDTE